MFKIDPHTRDQAIEFADNEAEIHGFEKNGAKWKKALNSYLSFAVGTMSVGRNPRLKRNPGSENKYRVLEEAYPEIFGADGFAAKMAKDYIDMPGASGSDDKARRRAMNDRVLSAVSNLMKLFENGGMHTRNTTKGNKPGKIDNKDMSDLQFPSKDPSMTPDEYQAAVKDVLYNWLVRDLITNCILESLHMFWTLDKSEVESIMDAVTINDATVKEAMGEGRKEFIRRLRAQVRPKLAALNYKKLVLG